MFWIQAGVCFLLWVGYGQWMRTRVRGVMARLSKMPRRVQSVLGPGLLLAGLGVLVGGLWGTASLGGLTEAGLTPWAWPLVGVIGLLFVHLQTLGALALFARVVPETRHTPSPSESNEAPRS